MQILKKIISIEEAVQLRDNHLKSGANKSITELLSLPIFFDWVACSVDKFKFKMFLAGGDDGVAMRFFWNQSYEKLTLKLWSVFAATEKNVIIIDIGSHTGAYTLTAMSAAPNATVISFEPHFMNFARLNLNIRANGYSPLNAFMLGISDKNGTAPFSIPTDISYLSSGGSIKEDDHSLQTIINTVSIDDFLNIEDATVSLLIKIDVEGHENYVIRGMIRHIKKYRPIIFFESTDTQASTEIYEELNSLGYEFYLIDDNLLTITHTANINPVLTGSGAINPHKLNRLAVHKSTIKSQTYGAILSQNSFF